MHGLAGKQSIVVGLDGSRTGVGAAEWAAHIAEARRAPLILVHCLEGSHRALHHDDALIEELLADPERLGAVRLLDATAGRLRRWHPTVDVETRLLPGFPGRTLVELSSTAALVVISGSRSTGGHLLVGSTVRQIADGAQCPVAVWRKAPNHIRAQRMPVVVGVDGTRSGDRAIAHAFEYAAMTGAPLEAVHAWTDGTFEHEAALVGERLAGWAEKYPEVEVTRCLREGNAAALLLERARRARLIVVGSHSHNRLTGAALGSTSKRLLHLAESPILICRSDSD